jgi:hypothetical protein
MNCPECNSPDISKDDIHADDLGTVCVCVECESTWIADTQGDIDTQTICKGENRRALQNQTDRCDFHRQFNDPYGFGL